MQIEHKPKLPLIDKLSFSYSKRRSLNTDNSIEVNEYLIIEVEKLH
jgi:hypothetical protein